MPVIDDLKFSAKTLLAKITRIDDIAKRVEKEARNTKDLALFKAMSADIDSMHQQYTETVQKIAAYNAKQNPRVEDDLEPDIVEFETMYYNAKAIADITTPQEEKSLNQSLNTAHSTPGHQSSPVGISLPTLKIVEFNGDIKAWANFSELYIATVHTHPQLSDIQKYMYLRSLLKGEALAQIASLPITAANYQVAWTALQSRYNDANLLTNSYLESLFSLNPVARDAPSLRTFATLLTEYTGALMNLGHDVEGWAVPVLFLLVKRLSPLLRERWEKFVMDHSKSATKITEFITFISNEARVLEAAQSNSASKKPSTPRNVATSPVMKKSLGTFVVHTPDKDSRCVLCKDVHFLAQCSQFRNKSPIDRHKFAKLNNLCLNCLNIGHMMKKCPSRGCCKQCSARHHTLLHFRTKSTDKISEEQPSLNSATESGEVQPCTLENTDTSVESYQTNTPLSTTVVILATAQALVQDSLGQYHKVKVLIDSASQGTFITRACAERLKLPVEPTSVPVFGMAQTTLGIAKGTVTCHFQRARDVELSMDALIVDSITKCPSMTVQPVNLQHLQGLKLADTDYWRSQSVDVLLGAEWFGSVVLGHTIVGPRGTPSAIDTIWGYCLVGRISGSTAPIKTFCTSVDNQLDQLIRNFWEVEQPPAFNKISEDDRVCEELYSSTVSRTPTGRYVVQLPWRSSAPVLGDSRAAALRRFQSLERRLSQKTGLRLLYNEFMADYLDQGHMIRACSPVTSSKLNYYIPHHCIFRDENPVTKFRVVFDASMKTTSGVSLNDTLHTGPKLQADILDLLITFRLHNVVLVTDIRQMYRNIAVSGKHQDFQRIFWRFKPEDPLEEFCLATVTYGVSASPFLAIRTLQQLVADEGAEFPAASRAITTSTYMDDIVTSVPSVRDALALQQELITLMARGGFELRKWMSNNHEVLKNLNPEHCAVRSEAFSFEDDVCAFTKILGLVWNPSADTFTYRITLTHTSVTKRTILSDIARLFDPLGYICPVTFFGKWLIQHLWQLGLGWDEPVPESVAVRWRRCRAELPQLVKVALPRNVRIDTALQVHLHGFADSSEKGYAGVIYLQSEQRDGSIILSLLIAKSKVAPLKRVTLPRLELCAVVLTAKLVHYVLRSLEKCCEITSATIWTDSKVALSWVQSSPHKWHTYVANRVSEAQSYISPKNYRHVPSEMNPADCASRGLLPSELLRHPLWLSGPPWLAQHSQFWPSSDVGHREDIQVAVDTEARIISLPTMIEIENTFLERIMLKVSSLTLLKRIVAWCLRFVHNAQNEVKWTGDLSAYEMSNALETCLRLVQQQEFADDIKGIATDGQATHRLRRLNPYLDDKGLLRVGGRLRHSDLTTAGKHPILVPKSHQLTLLIIDHHHHLHLHPGAQTLHTIIQAQYWIISARQVIRHRLSKCVTCFRTRPRHPQPIMGDLPAARLNAVKPFAITGVDYGGPFEITLGKIRKAKIYKAYICLFVCFATKAVHLELASELTTDAFLAALRRFIARRGHVVAMHSDCGTNFVGAKRKLEEWYQFISSSAHNEIIKRQLAERHIEWHLNPPSGPHFGGLWEAGIKSTKNLLRKVVGTQLLTYEEFYTFLVQVEATLNSRPLTPCSSDPNDLEPLTPGHFLLLEAPTALIEPEVKLENVTSNQRWKLLQHLHSSFWKRWHSEYLCTLQQRTKWTRSGPNITEGSLVLIKEDNAPPLQWRLGRVKRVFQGKDNVVRVAEVTTSTGVITRPVVKLCPLPID